MLDTLYAQYLPVCAIAVSFARVRARNIIGVVKKKEASLRVLPDDGGQDELFFFLFFILQFLSFL